MALETFNIQLLASITGETKMTNYDGSNMVNSWKLEIIHLKHSF